MVLLIDNYDSFTYNLYQYIEELGFNTKVFRNDVLTVEEIKLMKPKKIIISPGPGRPDEAGISKEVIKEFFSATPILGVCLGHQAMVEVFGGIVTIAGRIMHGKTSQVYHNGKGLYKGVENPFTATRYHSLIAKKEKFPKDFEIDAWTKDNEIMGIKHKVYPCFGVQYHPESILTTEGKKILNNFLKS